MKLLNDTWLMFERSVALTLRNPAWVVIGVVQPLFFLVLFGPLLQPITAAAGFSGTGQNAFNVFVPGLLIQLGLFGTAFVGFGLIAEMRAGVIERLRVTPVSRFALLLGRALRDILTLLVQALMIVLLSLPFALVGAVVFMALLGYNWSVATAIGFIALAGVAAETGVVMLIYLDHAWDARRLAGKHSVRDLYEAIMEGAVERVRPKMMTVCAIMAGLLPIMWSHGTGAEVMQRIAVPMIGGMVSSTLLTLIVIPAIYAAVKGAALRMPRLISPLQQPDLRRSS
jgi:hypothetical protein